MRLNFSSVSCPLLCLFLGVLFKPAYSMQQADGDTLSVSEFSEISWLPAGNPWAYPTSDTMEIEETISDSGEPASEYWSAFKEFFQFFWSFLKHPSQVGAIAPSSPCLAHKITACLDGYTEGDCETPGQSKRYLEVGAGTGAFTREIIKKKHDNDYLKVVEIDGGFYQKLDRQFSWRRNVDVVCMSILDLDPKEKYDVIISGLPLNAFPAELVQAILEKYLSLLTTNGVVAYFEYIGVAKIRSAWNYLASMISHRYETQRIDFTKTLATVQMFRDAFQHVNQSRVWLNLPPARVVVCSAPLITNFHLD